MPVSWVCAYCQTQFDRTIELANHIRWQHKTPIGTYHPSQDVINKTRQKNLGRVPWNKGLTVKTDPRLVKLSEANREANLKRFQDPKERLKCSWNREQTMETNPLLKKHSEQMKIRMNLSEIREMNSRQATEHWQIPEYVQKQMRARQVKPNGAEFRLQSILSKHFPGQFKYVGIEMFGCWWHRCPICCLGKACGRKDTEESTIKAYAQYGFGCIIIWEHELANEERILAKIEKY